MITITPWAVLAICAPASLAGIAVLRRRAHRARTAHIPRPRPTQAEWDADAATLLRRAVEAPLTAEPQRRPGHRALTPGTAAPLTLTSTERHRLDHLVRRAARHLSPDERSVLLTLWEHDQADRTPTS
ncbi:hypothetical protein [Kitasatospora sp. NPDC002965]|uniref:hypothetical protein n=1 Tax=Kitasatospora sp. NPDC002965 TaxID=3154775 RepID=UPI0033B1D110